MFLCLEELEALVSKIHRMQHSLVLSRFCQIKCACMKIVIHGKVYDVM